MKLEFVELMHFIAKVSLEIDDEDSDLTHAENLNIFLFDIFEQFPEIEHPETGRCCGTKDTQLLKLTKNGSMDIPVEALQLNKQVSFGNTFS